MPSALVINPNTTQWMTHSIARSAARVFQGPWKFSARQPPGGPASIESWFDTNLAATGMLALIKENPGVDGVVIACFGDPGLFMLREVLDIPVVGIAEAAFLTACMLGSKFGSLVGEHKDVPSLENVLWSYGLDRRSAGLAAIGVPILDMEIDPPSTLRALEAASEQLIAAGAETILLGCTGLSDFQQDLSDRLRIPVIDPVEAGCRQLQVLVDMGLTASRAGMFARTEPKDYSRLNQILHSDLAEWLQEMARGGFS